MLENKNGKRNIYKREREEGKKFKQLAMAKTVLRREETATCSM